MECHAWTPISCYPHAVERPCQAADKQWQPLFWLQINRSKEYAQLKVKVCDKK